MSADAWIAQHGPFNAEQATELLIQVAGALQAAHDANVVHRDIKPENLLVSSDGKAKLGDFGMALHTGRTRASDTVRVGTPFYTAPEIWRGNVASVSSDIYALGAMYHYLLTGRPPFVTSDLQELVNAHLTAPVPELKSPQGVVPAGCQELVRRCMAKTPAERYVSAQAVGWEARAQLKRLASIPPPSTSATSVYLDTRANLELKAFELAKTTQFPFYGFERKPFSQYDVGQPPYQGDPYQSLLTQLDLDLADAEVPALILAGTSGSGRTSLVQELLARRADRGACAIVSCKNKQSITKKLLWAFGVSVDAQGPSNNDIDHLVEHCLSMRELGVLPLVVIDDCDAATDLSPDFVPLAQAAQLTASFRVLYVTTVEFSPRLSAELASAKIPFGSHPLPHLDSLQVAAYVQSWLTATLRAGASPILFTPDALFIIAYRTQGNLARINRLLTNLLLLGSRHERRLLDSWDAWNTPFDSPSSTTDPRPESWPTPAVLEILNVYRTQVGLQLRK
jgi:hypothetical protein